MKHWKLFAITTLALTAFGDAAAGQWISPPGVVTYTFDQIGIGTSSPEADLHVRDDQSGGSFAVGGMRVDNLNPPASGERTVVISLKNNQAASGQDWLISNIGNSPGRGGNFEIRQIGPGVSNVGRFAITPTGNVGIGTVTPAQQLTFTECLRFDNAGTTNADVDFCNDDSTYGSTGVTLRTLANPANGQPIFRVLSSGGSARLQVEHNGRLYTSNYLYVAGTGNSYIAGRLGIGTASPSDKLQVEGDLRLNGNLVSNGDICIGSGC